MGAIGLYIHMMIVIVMAMIYLTMVYDINLVWSPQAMSTDPGPLHITESSDGAVGQFSWRSTHDDQATGMQSRR